MLFALLLASSVTLAGQDMSVVYPKFQSDNDTRYLEQVELLKTALEKTKVKYGGFKLSQSSVQMNELRYIQEAKSGMSVNVVWWGTNQTIEKELIPIRIPISKGLLGYRVFLINKDSQPKFTAIRSVDDLRKYRVGQGLDWGDVKVFEANRLPVVTGNNYEGLVNMLNGGAFEYFSRGINEAFNELETRRDKFPKMAVEEHLSLYYPWPYYFFVSPTTPKVAERLGKGLNIMISDGSFNAIFLKYNKSSIDKANLKHRLIIRINNPILPKETPLNRKELWFVP